MKIKVLIVDDSALVRQIVSDLLAKHSSIEVLGAASDPIIARTLMAKCWPDVIITDIEMPRKDGLTFMKEIMAERPTPIIICSGVTEENARVTMQALAAGAVAVISKPKMGMKQFLLDAERELVDAVLEAAKTNLSKLQLKSVPNKFDVKNTADVILPPPTHSQKSVNADRVVVIGASAGGTQAIEAVLIELPERSAGIVIVQHMPENFTAAFADRLDKICKIEVKESAPGLEVVEGRAIVAQGGKHTLLKRNGSRYIVDVVDGPPVSRHKPSVDVLFRSAAKVGGDNMLGIILTGMGDDGAAGMVEMRRSGIYTIAQDEETSAVYGMPKEAAQRGGAVAIKPLYDIPQEIVNFSNSR